MATFYGLGKMRKILPYKAFAFDETLTSIGKINIWFQNPICGGEGGIRTLGTLFTHTRFPGVHLKPLGHLSSQGFVVFEEVLFELMPVLNINQDSALDFSIENGALKHPV